MGSATSPVSLCPPNTTPISTPPPQAMASACEEGEARLAQMRQEARLPDHLLPEMGQRSEPAQ